MEVLRLTNYYIQSLQGSGNHGESPPSPTAPLDKRDHFGKISGGTSLSIVASRSLASLNNVIMDGNSSDAVKTVSRIAIGALSMIGVSAISLIETISRISLAVIAFSAVYLSCMVELVLKSSINIIVYTATLGQVNGLFFCPTFQEGRMNIIPFFFRPAMINVMSLTVGAHLGARIITNHNRVNFTEFVWKDNHKQAFSFHNFVFM